MPSVKLYLEGHLKKIVADLFEEAVEIVAVKPSDRPDLCDYQTNVAMQLTKRVQKSPRSIADKISEAWPVAEQAEVSVAGPGFINFTLTPKFLADFLSHQSGDMKMGAALAEPHERQKVVVDYGGPNAAKPMHVGHLRSSIIGDTLKRLYRFAGHEVVGDIHLGDWGTQMGMLLVGLQEKNPEWVYFDEGFTGPYPKESPVTLEALEALYPAISGRTKEDAELADACRKATQELQQGRAGYRALWRHFVDVSVQAMKESFEKLDVSFDLWYGESRYQEHLAPLVQGFLERGLAETSEGATVVRVGEEADKTEMPPVILQKSDGGYLYATTDLATLQERVVEMKADKVLYVVDGRQHLHFEQVFRAARKMGWTLDAQFIGFGTMNGPDGKPFKTRSGGVMRLADLIEMLETEALARLNEQPKLHGMALGDLQEIAAQIGVGALKFADLQHDPKQNYQFDLSKFMRFEGKTGPYLQYAAVRIKSLLEKAREEGWTQKEELQISFEGDLAPQERALIIRLCRFPETIAEALQHNAPNILCEAAFQLGQAFSAFYGACPVLAHENEIEKKNRLALCSLTLRALELYLSILGIQIPEKM